MDEDFRDRDWETLGKRLLAAMQIGIRIDQMDGHRWLYVDEDAEFLVEGLKPRHKQYGSYSSALDAVDEELARLKKPTLLTLFEQLVDQRKDLSVVFDGGVQ